MQYVRLIKFVFAAALLASLPVKGEIGDPPGRVARLSYARGNVSLQPAGETDWTAASTNYVVTTGDRLYTDANSRAELEIGPYAVRLPQTTDLTVVNLNDHLVQLGLDQGSLRLTVFEMLPQDAVEVDTPNGTATVLRAGFYRIDTDPSTGSTLVSVNSGSVQITGTGVSRTVNGGEAVQLTGTNPVQVSEVQLPANDDFDRWCEQRDRRIQSFAARQYVNQWIPGVEDLDAYGSWQVTADYGPVWFPATVAAGWAPYRFGHWVWVEPWGWTWIEDEPWGFCQFHFGRWALVGSVWGWVPGPLVVTPVYAPAFVAFLDGGGFSLGVGIGVEAWFPLGPRDPFFPWYHHGPTYLRQVNITNIRNVTNIENIINVRNINNVHYAYKEIATTAVPADVFRSGQHVAERVVHLPPQQLARATVAPHPNVAPARTAALGGRPRVRPPPVTPRPMVRTGPPPQVAGRIRPLAPNEAERRVIPGGTPAPQARALPPQARAMPPRLIARTPPPPVAMPFTARQPALEAHPGRPLEPLQITNLRAGRPAGPMRDVEFPPHPPAWRPPPPPQPVVRPMPPRRL